MESAVSVNYNNLTMAFMLLMIILNLKIGHKTLNRTSRYMLLMCVSIILILVSDTAYSIFLGIEGPFRKQGVYITSFLFFLFTPIPEAAWLLYLDAHMNEGTVKLKDRWYFLINVFVCLIIIVYNFFSGFIFYVDAAGNYHRGSGILLMHVINYIPFLAAIAITVKRRKTISARLIRIVVLFAVLPLISAQVQYFFPHITILWPVMAICIMTTYIFLEVQRINRDHLTGVYNRQQFENIINARIRKLGSAGPFTLIMMDLNDFKYINDTFGHDAGDQALKTTAQILIHSIHASDMVARLGGDEFVIILEEADRPRIEKIIQRLLSNIDKFNRAGEYPYRLSLSYGFATASSGGIGSYQELFNLADKKMYEYKRKLKADRTGA